MSPYVVFVIHLTEARRQVENYIGSSRTEVHPVSEAVRLSHTAALMLKTLKEGYSYGFSTSWTFTGLPSGTVYPALRRMEHDGPDYRRVGERNRKAPAGRNGRRGATTR